MNLRLHLHSMCYKPIPMILDAQMSQMWPVGVTGYVPINRPTLPSFLSLRDAPGSAYPLPPTLLNQPFLPGALISHRRW
jgi:hypothetical protein